MERFTGVLGILVVLAVAYLFSSDRRLIRPRVLVWGLSLQFGFAFLVLKTPVAKVFQAISAGVNHLLDYSAEGSKFVFSDKLGAPSDMFGTIFAFQVLPIIIFIAALFGILYYLGVMQILVRAMAVVMQRVFGTSGAESMNVAASIFMGQTEAPLTIRPFLAGMTESELFTVMASGMAHVSGAVMAAYVLIAHVEIRHLLTAVIMTAPATLMLAKMLIPESGFPATAGGVKIEVERPGVNIIDAVDPGSHLRPRRMALGSQVERLRHRRQPAGNAPDPE
jgi:CNT family concentrative nucleoside transporter